MYRDGRRSSSSARRPSTNRCTASAPVPRPHSASRTTRPPLGTAARQFHSDARDRASVSLLAALPVLATSDPCLPAPSRTAAGSSRRGTSRDVSDGWPARTCDIPAGPATISAARTSKRSANCRASAAAPESSPGAGAGPRRFAYAESMTSPRPNRRASLVATVSYPNSPSSSASATKWVARAAPSPAPFLGPPTAGTAPDSTRAPPGSAARSGAATQRSATIRGGSTDLRAHMSSTAPRKLWTAGVLCRTAISAGAERSIVASISFSSASPSSAGAGPADIVSPRFSALTSTTTSDEP